jgi:PAS domain S-box-containing protein
LTTKWHGLIWSEYRLDPQGDFFGFDVVHGAWFWVHFAYSYALLLAGAVLLVRSLVTRRGLYRGQILALLIAVSAPWIGNALFFTGYSPIPLLDLTPFALTVTVASLTWAVFGFRLAEVAPLARDLVVDSLTDGVVVLDAENRVVDINPAAARMIGVPIASAIGQNVVEIFRPWPKWVERFRGALEVSEEISVGAGEAKRRYHVRLSPLQDSHGAHVGRLIMLRSLGGEEVPPVSVGADAADSPDSPSVFETQTTKSRGWLLDFFFVSELDEIKMPSGGNPSWHRMLERNFTQALRLGVPLLAIGTFLAVGLRNFPQGRLVFLAFEICLFAVAVVRRVPFIIRAGFAMVFVYVFGLAELIVYGQLAEAMLAFVTVVVGAILVLGRRAGFVGLLATLVTLLVFGWLTSQRYFVPFAIPSGAALPSSLTVGIFSTVLIYAGIAFGIFFTLSAALDNLNRAWYLQTQTANLLQRERDLLEHRVTERTRDLADARDEALRSNNELRKYFRAIEQSGNTIVVTDTYGNIEYANPRFEKTTGYSVAEVIGRNPRILKSGNQPDEFYSQLWETITAGRVWEGEFLNKRKDNSLYWEYATIAPVMDQHGLVINYVAIKEEITQRKQAEDQLQKLSRAVEQSANTVIIMDRNGLIEYVNPKFTEVTGYSTEEALGKPPAVLMNGLDMDFDFRGQDWWLTVTAGQIWRGEFCNRRKDGAMFWESAAIAPVFNRAGAIINFVEIKQDVTEQKVLQDQLQKQNDYLSILHQVTLDLLNRRELGDLLQVVVDRSAVLLDAPFSELMIERDGVLVVEAFTANQTGLKGDRVSREEARLSWQAFDTHEPVVLEDYSSWEYRRNVYDSQPLHAVADFPVMAGDRCLGVLALGRSQSGHPFTAEQVETGILFARLVALVLDNANLYDDAVREIAERKRAEVLLQESEARFRQIVENASEIIYRADLKGNFTYLNPAALSVIGYANELEALGRNCIELVIPGYRKDLLKIYVSQYQNKTRDTYQEFPAVTLDGHMIWVGQNMQLIMDGEQVVGFQAVARNITQLKQAQDALALSRDQALEASRFKSQLLSRVSHELRTPLGGILGYAELLQYNAFGDLNDTQKTALENIIESTQYLTSVVNDLLDEAQIESKSLSLYDEYFHPADLLEKIRSTMAVLAGKKGLSFTAAMDDDLPGELYGDTNRLQQILVNLVGNAIKFTQEGEVSVRFRRPSPAQWSIEIRDTGAGIPLEDQQNIFEPFRQVNNSITRQNRGSGLGLAITKQLVELMDGQINLSSQPGEGSFFTVILPIKNAPGE